MSFTIESFFFFFSVKSEQQVLNVIGDAVELFYIYIHLDQVRVVDTRLKIEVTLSRCARILYQEFYKRYVFYGFFSSIHCKKWVYLV